MELIIAASVACAWASGFLFCRFTHRERGIEVDPWEQLLPTEPIGDSHVTSR